MVNIRITAGSGRFASRQWEGLMQSISRLAADACDVSLGTIRAQVHLIPQHLQFIGGVAMDRRIGPEQVFLEVISAKPLDPGVSETFMTSCLDRVALSAIG